MNRSQAFLLLLIALSAVASLYVLLPFLQYVLGALILSYLLYPFHTRLATRVGQQFSPIILIGLSFVAVVLPLFYVLSVLIEDVNALARGETDLELDQIEMVIAEYTGADVDIATALEIIVQDIAQVFFGGIASLIPTILHTFLGLALVAFLVYYTLRDGSEYVAWLRSLTPLPPPATDRLFTKIDRTTWGVIIGHFLTAVVQSLVAGAGLYLTGIPNVVFWSAVTMILALLPLIGAFMVWGPAALYLIVIDEVTAGITLALYGLFIVSMIDNYLRPIVIDQEARLNPSVILIGVFGGVYTVGFVGLFVGPIVIGILSATLEMFREEYDQLERDLEPL